MNRDAGPVAGHRARWLLPALGAGALLFSLAAWTFYGIRTCPRGEDCLASGAEFIVLGLPALVIGMASIFTGIWPFLPKRARGRALIGWLCLAVVTTFLFVAIGMEPRR